ncbi:MAG: hypothetical protein LBF66_03065 [Holosporales bacterium]|jgi:hypothetical protein|nr:hypothetical protein [Holosporales bacterium]
MLARQRIKSQLQSHIAGFLGIVLAFVILLGNHASGTALELFGTRHSAIYPDENSIYSKALYCHNVISHNPLLEENRTVMGDFLPSGEYPEDGVTVLSKIAKVAKLLASVRQNHSGQEASVLSDFEIILGAINDQTPTTIFGRFNTIMRTLNDASPDVGHIVLNLVGSTSDGVGADTLIGTLNAAIYTLSTKFIVEGPLAHLTHTIRQLPVSNELLTTTLNYFDHTVDALTHASLFFDDADILSVKQLLAPQEGNTSTVHGFVSAVTDLVASAPADLDDQLEALLGALSSPASLLGCLGAVASVVNTKIIGLLKGNKLRDAITPYFEQIVSEQNFELYQNLIRKIDDVTDDLQNAGLTADQTDDFFLSGFDCKQTISSIMNIYKISFDIFNRSNNFSSFIDLIGDKFTSLGLNTLSSFVAELMDGFYLHPIRQNLAKNVIKELATIDECIVSAGGSFAALRKAPYLGNSSFVDFESADTLSKKMQILQDALQRCPVDVNHSTASRLFNAIGTCFYQANSVWANLRQICASVKLSDLDSSMQAILRSKSIVDELLILLHKSVFFDYLRTVEADISAVSPIYEQLSFQSGLDSVLQDSHFHDIAPFFADDSYTCPPQIIVDFYGIMGALTGGSMPGGSMQTSLAGNVLALTKDVLKDLEYLRRHVGQASDLRASPYSSTANTLHGNINWMTHQINENRVCSCLHTGTLLRSLSNDIATLSGALDSIGGALDVVIANHPTMAYVESSLTFIEKALGAIDTHISTIYAKKNQQFDQTRCQSYRINVPLQNLRNVLSALINHIQQLLPDGLPPQDFSTPVALDAGYFYQSLDDVVQQAEVLAGKFADFTFALSNVKFLPLSSNAPQLIESIHGLFSHIASTLNDMGQTNTLAHHLGEDKSPAFLTLSSSVVNMQNSLGELNRLSLLQDSHITFLGQNIFRLLTEVSNTIAAVFSDNQFEIDLIVKNRAIEPYLNTFARMAKSIVRSLPLEKSLLYKRASLRQTTTDENVYLEKSLTTITNIVFGGLNILSKLAANLFGQNVSVPPKYVIGDGVQYRELPTSYPSIYALAQSITNHILPLARNSNELSYSPSAISALQALIGCISEVQTHATEMMTLCAEDSALSPALSVLTDALTALLDEFNNPRCCTPVLGTIAKINHTTAEVTNLFVNLIDVVFSPVAALMDPAALTGSFAQMGAGIRSVAGTISLLSQRIRTLNVDFSQKLCFSRDILTEVTAVLDSMRLLRDTLAATLQAPVSEGESYPGAQDESRELYETATTLGRWSQKLHELAVNVTNKLIAEASSTDFSTDLSNSSFTQILAIFEATPYLAPFFTSIVHSLKKLCEALNPGGSSCKHLCVRGSKNITPSIMFLAQNVANIVNEIQLLIDVSEPIRSITFAQATKQVIIRQAHQHCVLGTGSVVFYRHAERPSLFILRDAENFFFDGTQVSHGDDGVITAPGPIVGEKISKFAPISLFHVIKEDVVLLQKIKACAVAYQREYQTRRS